MELPANKEKIFYLVSVLASEEPVVAFEPYSTITHIQLVVAWILWFFNRCK